LFLSRLLKFSFNLPFASDIENFPSLLNSYPLFANFGIVKLIELVEICFLADWFSFLHEANRNHKVKLTSNLILVLFIILKGIVDDCVLI